LQTPSDFEQAYLSSDDPRAQSGFNGSAERWEAARRLIVEAIDGPGTFLDVGCANGLLLESVVAWSAHEIEPYGVDFAPGLVELAPSCISIPKSITSRSRSPGSTPSGGRRRG